MKPLIPSEKKGAALIVVMAVLVAVTLLVGAILQLSWFNERDTIRQLRLTQAHWLAEAGLERGLSQVMSSKDYRETLPAGFSNDETLLGGIGSYSVAITRNPNPTNSMLVKYTITSSGTVSNGAISASDTVRVQLEGAPGGQQALMGLDGSISKIAANITVNGTIYQDGVLDIANGNQQLNDIIEATEGITGNTGAATEGDLPDPIPGPRIKAEELAAYSNMWVDATLSTNSYSGAVINLNGGTTNYHADTVTLSGTITGPGTIAVSSNLTVKTTIPDNVNLIAGGIIDLNGAVMNGNNTLFTFRDIDMNKVTFTGSFVNLLAMGGIQVTANINTFAGILYTDGIYRDPAQDKNYYGIIFKSGNQAMSGTIIAWKGFYMGSNAVITYDPSVFANPNPVNYGNSLAIQIGTWQRDESPLSSP